MNTQCPECKHRFQSIDVDGVMSERKLIHEVLEESREVERLRAAIRHAVTRFDKIRWGYDGDGGCAAIMSELEDSLENKKIVGWNPEE
jgi:hypothetical protein